jgi:hypothetical protein
VDFRFLALTVRDAAAPTFTVGHLPSYAAGTETVIVAARDAGVGLAGVRASLGVVPLAASALGGEACRDLSPGAAAIDLPLADDCPATARVPLALDSTRVADGVHELALTVTDATGNATVERIALKVVNHPPVTVAPAPPATPAPAPAAPAPPAAVAVLRPATRYAVSRSGRVTVSVSCPAGARTSCPVRLTLTAKLPGARRAGTIARARRSVAPGASTRPTLKLSKAALRAVRRHALRARLTLAGAKPASVKLSA